MKKRKWNAVLAVVLCIGLTSCYGGEKKAETVTASPSSEPTETAGNTIHEDNANSVVVYSPHDAEPLNAAVVSFMKKYPDIKVEIVAGGTGELCERIKAGEADPHADILWGGGADSIAAYADLFEEYHCENESLIDPRFRDAAGKWTGESPLPMVIIYNKKLLSEKNIAPPTSWQDCLKEEFKGQIAYCRPSKSGSAYTQLCTMILANGGKDAGWDYVKKFVAGLDGKILESSGQCHKLVASGEYLIGITIEKSAATYLNDPTIGFSYPSEGTSAVPDATAIVKNCRHKENAQIFMNFVTSADCETEQSRDWKRRPSRSDVTIPEGLIGTDKIALVNYDFNWAANNKTDIINRFNEIFGK